MSVQNDDRRLLDDAPEGSELERWEADGKRMDYSNIVSWTSPNERYLLEITLDDPVMGWLLRLFRLGGAAEPRSSECRIGQTIVDKGGDIVLKRAAAMAAAADELDDVDENPTLGPEYPDLEIVEHPDYTPTPPDGWTGTDDQWEEKVQAALGKARDENGRLRGRPAISRKEIDGSAYYYLQWRSGDTVQSQYVAPVEP